MVKLKMKLKQSKFVINSIRSAEGTPVLPPVGMYDEPTMQGPIVREFMKEYKSRTKRLTDVVDEMLRELETKQSVAFNAKKYVFLVDTDEVISLVDRVKNAISKIFFSGATKYKQGKFWTDMFLNKASKAGERDALQSAKSVTTASGAGLALASGIRGEDGDVTLEHEKGRALRTGLAGGRVFESMKGITDTLKVELANTLSRGIQEGKGVQEIASEIQDRINVSGSRAMRIARTEVNQAYRAAGRAETQRLNKEVYANTDFELRMLWFSALAATTRSTHARRHGRTYTMEEVEAFYSKDANAINCLCNQTQVLYNKKTKQVVQKDLQQKMQKQKTEYFKDLPEEEALI